VFQSFFEEEFPSTYDAMSAALDRAVEALLANACVPRDREPCARLCVEEALANAVEHGNQGDPARTVRVELAADGDRCRIRVYDEGNGFRPEQVKDPEPEQMGGRGICLIRHYMSEVAYLDEEHCLQMVFPCKDTC